MIETMKDGEVETRLLHIMRCTYGVAGACKRLLLWAILVEQRALEAQNEGDTLA